MTETTFKIRSYGKSELAPTMVRYILQHLIGGGHFFEKKGAEMFQNYIR